MFELNTVRFQWRILKSRSTTKITDSETFASKRTRRKYSCQNGLTVNLAQCSQNILKKDPQVQRLTLVGPGRANIVSQQKAWLSIRKCVYVGYLKSYIAVAKFV